MNILSLNPFPATFLPLSCHSTVITMGATKSLPVIGEILTTLESGWRAGAGVVCAAVGQLEAADKLFKAAGESWNEYSQRSAIGATVRTVMHAVAGEFGEVPGLWEKVWASHGELCNSLPLVGHAKVRGCGSPTLRVRVRFGYNVSAVAMLLWSGTRAHCLPLTYFRCLVVQAIAFYAAGRSSEGDACMRAATRSLVVLAAGAMGHGPPRSIVPTIRTCPERVVFGNPRAQLQGKQSKGRPGPHINFLRRALPPPASAVTAGYLGAMAAGIATDCVTTAIDSACKRRFEPRCVGPKVLVASGPRRRRAWRTLC